MRMFSAAGMALLFVIIMATGNYNFFILLSLSLCVLLLDDAFWQWALPDQLLDWIGMPVASGSIPSALSIIIGVVATIYLLVSAFQLLETLTSRRVMPGIVRSVERFVDPLRVINTYGLFRVMTTRRPEIVIEGSNDGKAWQEYEFKWKPGDLKSRPKFVEPHQPRLDWQMWFAALSRFERTQWFQQFMGRLLEGESSVLGLLKRNPFPGSPPKYIRAVLYEYEFTSVLEGKSTGAWWKRESRGLYAPVLSLQ
jgi:lipase maturation factor 1